MKAMEASIMSLLGGNWDEKELKSSLVTALLF